MGEVEFINERLAVMEAAALAASNPPWTALTFYPNRSEVVNESDIDDGVIVRTPRKDDADAEHIALNDPATVLTLVTGLRAIVTLHTRATWQPNCSPPATYSTDRCPGCRFAVDPCPTIVALAAALGYAAPTAPLASGEPVRGGCGGEAQRGLRGAQGRSAGLGEGE